MSSSSDSESDHEEEAVSRLGKCEVCGDKEALYTCPKCEVKTCCLDCVRIHKKELECDGVRDRTKFIRMKNFTDGDLLSDYRLLEECARFVYSVKRDEKKKYTRIDKELPIHLYKLKIAARNRGTVIQFLAHNFTRHKCNTTKYNPKSNLISWRLEWVFPNAEPEPVKFVDARCAENIRISQLLDKYLNPEAVPFDGSKSLEFYKSVGLSGVKVLMRAEKVKGSAKKFFEIDTSETLAENLSGKCVVEFPMLFVVLKDHAYNFEIITPEDEFDYENEDKSNLVTNDELEENQGSNISNGNALEDLNQSNSKTNRKRPLLTEKIAQEKKIELEKELKAEKKKRPKNLLFTTGYSSEESLGDSDVDDVNESNDKV